MSSGGSPPRIAGTTKSTSTTKVTPSPTSAVTPRSRPNATRATTKASASIHSCEPRWWSTTAQVMPSGVSVLMRITPSPSASSGAPGPLGSGASSSPLRGAPSTESSSRATYAVPQPLTSSGSSSSHSTRSSAVTVPVTSGSRLWPSGVGRGSGHSQTIATSVMTARGAMTSSASRCRPAESSALECRGRWEWWAPMGGA